MSPISLRTRKRVEQSASNLRSKPGPKSQKVGMASATAADENAEKPIAKLAALSQRPGPRSKKLKLAEEIEKLSNATTISCESSTMELPYFPQDPRDSKIEEEKEGDSSMRNIPSSKLSRISNGSDSGFSSISNGGDDIAIINADRSKQASPQQKQGKDDKEAAPVNSQTDDDKTTEEYEIEDVLDYVIDTYVGEKYLVKWKDWSYEFNTWESIETLTQEANCEHMLIRFYHKRKAEVETQIAMRKRDIWLIPPYPIPLEKRLADFYAKTKPLDQENIVALYRKMGKRYFEFEKWKITKLDKYINDSLAGKLSEKGTKELRKQLYQLEVEKMKENMDTKLQAWEKEINTITNGRPKITVENFVDLEGPPENFKYVADYVPAEGIIIPNDPIIGCECVSNKGSCYDNRKEPKAGDTNNIGCCALPFNSTFAYNRFKKIAVPVGTPVYECNSKCECGPECINRVVQDGSSDVALSIFRTPNGTGWGVKALKSIKKGVFVALYVGEVIKTADSVRTDPTYLFELDFNNHQNPPYTVDASKLGNVSHFFNHSCDPNLGVYSVWVDCVDPDLNKIAMFSLKDIAAGEELSFDYTNQLSSYYKDTGDDDVGSESENENTASSSSSVLPKKQELPKIPCLCGADNCRKFLYA